MKAPLIGLTGLPRSGKDTVADYLVLEYGYTKLSFAGPLKEAAAILLDRPVWQMRGEQGFDREAILPEWGLTTRDFLQRFGTEAIRNNFGADFWVQRMRIILTPACGPQSHERYVVTDCRFENEAALIREMGGDVLHMWRPGCVRSSHPSDAGVRPDYILDNSHGLKELYGKVDRFLFNA